MIPFFLAASRHGTGLRRLSQRTFGKNIQYDGGIGILRPQIVNHVFRTLSRIPGSIIETGHGIILRKAEYQQIGFAAQYGVLEVFRCPERADSRLRAVVERYLFGESAFESGTKLVHPNPVGGIDGCTGTVEHNSLFFTFLEFLQESGLSTGCGDCEN